MTTHVPTTVITYHVGFTHVCTEADARGIVEKLNGGDVHNVHTKGPGGGNPTTVWFSVSVGRDVGIDLLLSEIDAELIGNSRVGGFSSSRSPESELRGRVVRHERQTLRERDYLAMEMTRQGWEDGPGYRVLQDALDALDVRDFALRATADLLGLPEGVDPLDDLDGLVRRVRQRVERTAEAEAELTRHIPPHCEHSADSGHALGHGEHADRGGPSLLDREIERLGARVMELQTERDRLLALSAVGGADG